MATLDRIVAGQSVTIEEKFIVAGEPFVVNTPVSWTILDPNSNLVMQGTAAQDHIDPTRWYSVITLPENLPLTDESSRYSLIWKAKNDTKELEKTQLFQVIAPIDYSIIEIDRLQKEKTNLIDSLAVNYFINIVSINVKVLTNENIEIYNSGSMLTSPIDSKLHMNRVQDKKVYTFVSPTALNNLTVEDANFKPFLIEWEYVTDLGAVEREYHFLYVVNPKVIIYAHQLRQMIDKVRFEHPNPNLRFTDVDLVSYLDLGLNMVNFSKPTLTSFNLANMPNAFNIGLLNAAAYCALSAQYLAEGQSAFNFSGQSVSLEIDRTQFIDSAMQRFMQYLETTLPTIKRAWLRSTGGSGGTGAGVLGINVGPSVNIFSRNVRYGLYRQLLLNR